MQVTSALYKELLAANHKKETRLTIGETGKLITKQGEPITFGGVSILVGSTGADGGYDESLLISIGTNISMFEESKPTVGCCVSGEINVEMLKPYGEIPKQARLSPYVRLTDGTRHSEWIRKGVFFLDAAEKKEDGTGIEKIILHGYDSMLKAEQDYPESGLAWPAKDIDVVREIAFAIGVPVDKRTVNRMFYGYAVQYPAGYSCREVLGYIAAMYAGCFVMSDTGELLLVSMSDIPPETRYLVNKSGQAITFGGVRILV